MKRHIIHAFLGIGFALIACIPFLRGTSSADGLMLSSIGLGGALVNGVWWAVHMMHEVAESERE